METHKGVSNAHTVGMLEYGAKWIDLKYTQKDMEFSELRRVTREEIREAFGIHGHKLGLSETVNRANADAAEYTYAKDKLVPRADRWKGALNNDLLRLFDPIGMGQKAGYEFCYTSPVPEDREADNAERTSKASAFKVYIDAGADPEYAAMVVGLPPPVMAERSAATATPASPVLETPGGDQPANGPESPGGNDAPAGGEDGAATDTLRTWAPVKLSARALPAMLNSIHAEVGRGR